MPEALAATKDARPSKLRAEIINLLKITENKKKEKKKNISLAMNTNNKLLSMLI